MSNLPPNYYYNPSNSGKPSTTERIQRNLDYASNTLDTVNSIGQQAADVYTKVGDVWKNIKDAFNKNKNPNVAELTNKMNYAIRNTDPNIGTVTVQGSCDYCKKVAKNASMANGVDVYGSAEGDPGVELLEKSAMDKKIAHKDALAVAVARAMNEVFNTGIDLKGSPESIAKAIIANLPIKPGVKLQENPEKMKGAIYRLAEIVNKYYSDNLFDLSKNPDPFYVCQQVADVVFSVTANCFQDFILAVGGIRRVLNNMRIIETTMRALVEDSIGKSNEPAVRERAAAAAALCDILKLEIEKMTGFISANLTSAERDLSKHMKTSEELNQYLYNIEDRMKGTKLADQVKRVFQLLGSQFYVSSRVNEVLKKLNLTVSQLRDYPKWTDVEKIIIDKNLLTDASVASAMRELRGVYHAQRNMAYGSAEPYDYDMGSAAGPPSDGPYPVGMPSGNAEMLVSNGISKFQKLTQEENERRKIVFSTFGKQIVQAYERIMKEFSAVIDKMASGELKPTSHMDELNTAISLLAGQGFLSADSTKNIIGFYKDATAIKARHTFIHSLKSVLLAIQSADEGNAQHFAGVSSAVSALISLLDQNADRIADIYGAAETGLSGDEDNYVAKTANKLKFLINRFNLLYTLNKQISNILLQSARNNRSANSEEYTKNLGMAIAEQIKDIRADYDSFSKKVDVQNNTDKMKAGFGDYVFTDANRPTVKDYYGEVRKVISDRVRVRMAFYKFIEAFDIFLDKFTLKAPQRIGVMRNLSKILEDYQVIADFYDDSTGTDLVILFEGAKRGLTTLSTTPAEYSMFTVSVDQVDQIKILREAIKKSEHYYKWISEGFDRRGHNTGLTGLVKYEDYKTYLVERFDRFYNNFALVKNFFSAVFNIGTDIIPANELPQTPSVMYNTFSEFLRHASFRLAAQNHACKLPDVINRKQLIALQKLIATFDKPNNNDDLTNYYNEFKTYEGDNIPTINHPLAYHEYTTMFNEPLTLTTDIRTSIPENKVFGIRGFSSTIVETNYDLTTIRDSKIMAITFDSGYCTAAGILGKSGDEFYNMRTEKTYMMHFIKAAFTKIMTIVGMHALYKTPNKPDRAYDFRIVMGSAEGVGAPTINDEILKLYFYVPLLMNFYNNVFKKGNIEMNTNTVRLIPDFGEYISKNLLVLCFIKAANYTTNSQYSIEDSNMIISEINRIYNKVKAEGSADPLINTLNQIIDDVNRCISALANSDMKYIEDYRDTRDRTKTAGALTVNDGSDRQFAILAGEDEGDRGRVPLPSDAYGMVGMDDDREDRIAPTKLNTAHFDLIEAFLKKVRVELLGTNLDLTKNENIIEYSYTLNKIVRDIKDLTENDRKLTQVYSLIQGKLSGLTLRDMSYVMMHDVLLTQFDLLGRLNDYLASVVEDFNTIDVEYQLTTDDDKAGYTGENRRFPFNVSMETLTGHIVNMNVKGGKITVKSITSMVNFSEITFADLKKTQVDIDANTKASALNLFINSFCNISVMYKAFIQFITRYSSPQLDIRPNGATYVFNYGGVQKIYTDLLQTCEAYLSLFTFNLNQTTRDKYNADYSTYANNFTKYFSTNKEEPMSLTQIGGRLNNLFTNYINIDHSYSLRFVPISERAPDAKTLEKYITDINVLLSANQEGSVPYLNTPAVGGDFAYITTNKRNRIDFRSVIYNFSEVVNYKQDNQIPVTREGRNITDARYGLVANTYDLNTHCSTQHVLHTFNSLLNKTIRNFYDVSTEKFYGSILGKFVDSYSSFIAEGGAQYPDTLPDFSYDESFLKSKMTAASVPTLTSYGLGLSDLNIPDKKEQALINLGLDPVTVSKKLEYLRTVSFINNSYYSANLADYTGPRITTIASALNNLREGRLLFPGRIRCEPSDNADPPVFTAQVNMNNIPNLIKIIKSRGDVIPQYVDFVGQPDASYGLFRVGDPKPNGFITSNNASLLRKLYQLKDKNNVASHLYTNVGEMSESYKEVLRGLLPYYRKEWTTFKNHLAIIKLVMENVKNNKAYLNDSLGAEYDLASVIGALPTNGGTSANVGYEEYRKEIVSTEEQIKTLTQDEKLSSLFANYINKLSNVPADNKIQAAFNIGYILQCLANISNDGELFQIVHLIMSGYEGYINQTGGIKIDDEIVKPLNAGSYGTHGAEGYTPGTLSYFFNVNENDGNDEQFPSYKYIVGTYEGQDKIRDKSLYTLILILAKNGNQDEVERITKILQTSNINQDTFNQYFNTNKDLSIVQLAAYALATIFLAEDEGSTMQQRTNTPLNLTEPVEQITSWTINNRNLITNNLNAAKIELKLKSSNEWRDKYIQSIAASLRNRPEGLIYSYSGINPNTYIVGDFNLKGLTKDTVNTLCAILKVPNDLTIKYDLLITGGNNLYIANNLKNHCESLINSMITAVNIIIDSITDVIKSLNDQPKYPELGINFVNMYKTDNEKYPFMPLSTMNVLSVGRYLTPLSPKYGEDEFKLLYALRQIHNDNIMSDVTVQQIPGPVDELMRYNSIAKKAMTISDNDFNIVTNSIIRASRVLFNYKSNKSLYASRTQRISDLTSDFNHKSSLINDYSSRPGNLMSIIGSDYTANIKSLFNDDGANGIISEFRTTLPTQDEILSLVYAKLRTNVEADDVIPWGMYIGIAKTLSDYLIKAKRDTGGDDTPGISKILVDYYSRNSTLLEAEVYLQSLLIKEKAKTGTAIAIKKLCKTILQLYFYPYILHYTTPLTSAVLTTEALRNDSTIGLSAAELVGQDIDTSNMNFFILSQNITAETMTGFSHIAVAIIKMFDKIFNIYDDAAEINTLSKVKSVFNRPAPLTYQAKNTIHDAIDILENSQQDISIGKITSAVEGVAASGGLDLNNLTRNVILDLGIMPINANILKKDIPLSNLYIYSANIKTIIRDYIIRSKILDQDQATNAINTLVDMDKFQSADFNDPEKLETIANLIIGVYPSITNEKIQFLLYQILDKVLILHRNNKIVNKRKRIDIDNGIKIELVDGDKLSYVTRDKGTYVETANIISAENAQAIRATNNERLRSTILNVIILITFLYAVTQERISDELTETVDPIVRGMTALDPNITEMRGYVAQDNLDSRYNYRQ
jgi:hypothetical protein